MAAGGILVRRIVSVFTSNGTSVAPAGLAALPAAYLWGSGGNSVGGGSSSGAGGGGGAAFAGEPAYAGVASGTTLTITLDTPGNQSHSSITGGSAAIQANSGKNNTGTSTGGAGGTAGTNTIAEAGGHGGNATATDGGGGGGGGAAGSTGAGGNAPNNSGTGSTAGGAAGTGAAGPPSLAGAAGAASGAFDANGNNGTAPGSGAGGPGALISTTATGGTAQAIIEYVTVRYIPAPWHPLARTRQGFTQRVTGTAPSGTVTPGTPNRQPPLRPPGRPGQARAFTRSATGKPFTAAPNRQPPLLPRPSRQARAITRQIAGTIAAPVTPGTPNAQAPMMPRPRRQARAIVLYTPAIPAAAAAQPEAGQVYYPYHHRARARGRGR